MANDRLTLKCRKCGEEKVLFKYYPTMSYVWQEGLQGWMIKHVTGCFSPGMDLDGERCFDIITESNDPKEVKIELDGEVKIEKHEPTSQQVEVKVFEYTYGLGGEANDGRKGAFKKFNVWLNENPGCDIINIQTVDICERTRYLVKVYFRTAQ